MENGARNLMRLESQWRSSTGKRVATRIMREVSDSSESVTSPLCKPLTRQMHKIKCVTTGGVLKEYVKELEQEPEDLIGEGDDPETEDEGTLYFGWERHDKRYRLVDS